MLDSLTPGTEDFQKMLDFLDGKASADENDDERSKCNTAAQSTAAATAAVSPSAQARSKPSSAARAALASALLRSWSRSRTETSR